MVCEIHPEFSFNDQNGFLLFKFQLTNPSFDILSGKILASGFELFIDNVDLVEEKSKRKPGLLGPYIGKAGRHQIPRIIHLIDP